MAQEKSFNKSSEEIKKLNSFYTSMFKILDILWGLLPDYLGTFIATILLFLAGSILRGDWLFILVHFIKYFKINDDGNQTSHEFINDSLTSPKPFLLKDYYLEDVSSFIVYDLLFAYSMYFIVCGYLQWYFYIRQRDRSNEWKCQPGKFLHPDIEKHEIILGSLNVGLGGVIFATLACYVYNGGPTAMYINPEDYGWTYLILTIPIHFLYQDAGAYYCHRILHLRFFYVNFHKWHHYYKQPTAFSATAMHPAEMMFFQMFMLIPCFIVPINAFVYIGTMVYIYYYGLITHSGIEMEALWPWQPKVSFHDNHHQYFHVNFGFNTTIFDKLHGTMRKKDRVYNETIFGGYGIALKSASNELKIEHAQELAAELNTKTK